MFQAMFARRAVMLALVVCGLALTLAGPLRVYLTQQHEMAQSEAEESRLQSEIDGMREKKAQKDDKANTVIEARKMGYVFPGEIPVQVALPPEPQTQSTPAAQEQHREGPWYGRVWHSIAVPSS